VAIDRGGADRDQGEQDPNNGERGALSTPEPLHHEAPPRRDAGG